MSVKIAPPVRGLGKRTALCKGDEARVSRICLGPGKKDLVERVQPFHNDVFLSQEFAISIRQGYDKVWPPSDAAYHLQKFFSLRLAKALFPENFPECKEIRLFSRFGHMMSATYSDFVADETGVVARRAKNMKQYYRMLYSPTDSESFGHAKAFCSQCDETENKLNPALAPLVRKMHISGIGISHPEANYHIEGGKTVLFEVNGLRLMRAYAASCASPNRQAALDALSTVLSICILDCALCKMKELQTYYPFLYSAKRQDGLWVLINIKRVILGMLAKNDETSRYLLHAMHESDGKAFFHALNTLLKLSNQEVWTQCANTPQEDWESLSIMALLCPE
jgi:hypothetical protein